MEIYEVLRRPITTEKSTMLQEQSKYAFEVALKANKHQIKNAVEKAFNVKVTSVNVLNIRGRRRRVGRHFVVTSSWKKAIVTLEPGNKIELFEGV